MTLVQWPCGCTLPIVGTEGSTDVINVEFGEALPKNISLDIYKIDRDCRATWELISSGRTKGVFQLETALGRQWSKKLKPQNIEDMGAVGALLRPGCLRAMSGNPPKSMTQRYCDRRHHLEEVVFADPVLKPILAKTQGVLVFQEQAMKIAVAVAGFDEQEADVLRKAIGKKKPEIMAEIKKGFIDGAKKAGIIDTELAEEVFGWIQESQRYSFNKSHADAYGLDGYWSAFCKTHFPLQFYCSWLRGASWKADKKQEEIYELVNDAKIVDIDVCVPDLRDKRKIFYIKDGRVYFGLSSIKGVGRAAIQNIIQGLQETEDKLNLKLNEWSWLQYLIFGTQVISKDITEALISAGALDWFKIPRNQMLYEYDIWLKLTQKEQDWIAQQPLTNESKLKDLMNACQPVKKDGGGCHNVNRSAILKDLVNILANPPHSLDDTPDWIAWAEQRSLGAAITCSKIDACEDSIQANCTCKEFLSGRKDYMLFAVEIVRVKSVKTKKGKNPGQDMAFLTLSDHSASIEDVVCFPNVWKDCRDAMYEGNTILLQGERGNNGTLMVKKVWQI